MCSRHYSNRLEIGGGEDDGKDDYLMIRRRTSRDRFGKCTPHHTHKCNNIWLVFCNKMKKR